MGPGQADPELITVKAQKLLERCPVILYAGSLVPKELIDACQTNETANVKKLIDTASLHLTEIIEHISQAHKADENVARVHSGDPSVYGAIGEQIRLLKKVKNRI